MFERAPFWQMTLSADFIDDLKELNSYSSEDSWFPPAIQWIIGQCFLA
jgi:hypothetical protein